MTTICAIRYTNNAVIGADRSRSSSYKLPPARKLVEHAGWVFGAAGQTSVIQAVNLALPPLLEGVTDQESLVRALNTLRHSLREEWGVRSEHEAADIQELQCPLILAGPPGLFMTSEDGAVLEIPPLHPVAIGSGERFALGAAWAVSHDATVCPVKVGLAAAAAFDLYTGTAVDTEQVPCAAWGQLPQT